MRNNMLEMLRLGWQLLRRGETVRREESLAKKKIDLEE